MRDSEYSGNVKQFYTPAVESYKALPTERQHIRDVEQWKEETNRRLKETDSGEVVTNSVFHTFLIVFSIFSLVTLIVIAGYFVYYVGDGRLKSVNTQSVNLEPQIGINNTVNNDYQTDNQFDNNFGLNATIIIENVNIFTNST